MYSYHIFDKNGNRKRVISQTMSDFSYSEKINGGQGDVTLALNEDFSYSGIKKGDILRVYKGTQLIYSGVHTKIRRVIDNNSQFVELEFLGLFSFFSNIYYKLDGELVFNKNDDPANIVKDIVDQVNEAYPYFSYDDESVPSYGQVMEIQFDVDTCRESIQSVSEVMGRYFFVDRNGKVFCRNAGDVDHSFLVGKDIDTIDYEEDIEDAANRLFVQYDGGVASGEDTNAINDYGVKEEYYSKSNKYKSTSVNDFITNQLIENSDGETKLKVTINKNYNLESIQAGDVAKMLNIKHNFGNMQIHKYNYKGDTGVLEFGEIDSFANQIIKLKQ